MANSLEPFAKTEVRIAVLGGGTGSFTLLSALKQHTSQLAAVVSMADDGGSTGVLRDELGALPPGDVRQCLVALSDSPKVRDLFSYRFEEGTFGGHSFGNILLTALEKVTGNFTDAVETASEILRVKGTVIPATLEDVRLKMEWPEASVVLSGERVIDAGNFEYDPRRATLSLVPEPAANLSALAAIRQADLVVIAPGDLYTSLGALLVVPGIGQALRETSATCLYVSNLVTKVGQTEGFTVNDHAAEIERLAGAPFLDYVLYNQQSATEYQAGRYRQEGAYITEVDHEALRLAAYQPVGGDFLGTMATPTAGDVLKRSLIRHDAQAVAAAIMDVYHRDEDRKFYR